MKITLKKMDNKPSIITITRNDGTTTWSRLHPNLEDHDLAHYAVESILEIKDAFFGLIEEGYAISDFGLPREQKPARLRQPLIPEHALQVEHLVNLLQMEYLNEGSEIDIIGELSIICSSHQIAVLSELDPKSLAQIRKLYHDLSDHWSNLSSGDELSLFFKI